MGYLFCQTAKPVGPLPHEWFQGNMVQDLRFGALSAEPHVPRVSRDSPGQ